MTASSKCLSNTEILHHSHHVRLSTLPEARRLHRGVSTLAMSFLRNPFLLLGVNLSAIAGSTYYLRSHHIYNLEEHEARMDELEGTLRGHIGYIEEALDRLEGKATEAERGSKM